MNIHKYVHFCHLKIFPLFPWCLLQFSNGRPCKRFIICELKLPKIFTFRDKHIEMELTFRELKQDIVRRIDAFYTNKDCFIEVLPGNVIVPRKFMEIGESIRNLKTYPDDVWLVSYPRTGSTWAQEMIWLLGNRLDFEGAKQMQQIRSPIIELSALFSVDHHEWVS